MRARGPLQYLFYGALAMLALSAVAADRVVELSVDGEGLGTVLLHESEYGLLLPEADFPAHLLSEASWQGLRRVGTDACARCLVVEDLGFYQEDPRRGVASLTLRPNLVPLQQFSLFSPRDASARHLQRDFAFLNNFTFSVRDAEGEDPSGLVIWAGRLSLGRMGVLEGGTRSLIRDSDTDTRRLPVKLVNHFIDQQVSYELGEVRTDGDPNDTSVGIVGLRIFRNFATRPDITARPLYDFFAQLERPSVIELYLDSQRVRREQVDRPGPVQLDDFRPSGSGKVMLLVTDALGTQRLVETDLMFDRRNLGRGIWDFALAGGALRGGDGKIDSDSYAGSLRVSRGMTNSLTFGLVAEGADFDEQSRFLQDVESVWRAGGNLLWTTALGAFDISGKYGENSEDEDFYAWRASWRKVGLLGNVARYSVGVAAFEESEHHTTIGGRKRELDGWRTFAGLSFRNVYVSGNYFDINDVDGYGVGAGLRLGNFALDASVEVIDDRDTLYTLSAGYSFGGRVRNVRAGVKHRENSDTVESFAAIRGGNRARTVNWRASVFHDDATHDTRGAVGVGWSHESFNAAYQARYVNERYEHFADLTFGVGVSKKGAMYFGRRFSPREGLALVDTELPDVGFSVGGRYATSNRRGLGVVPVTGFGRRFVTIDTSTLPEGKLVPEITLEVSTVPGQASYARFVLNAPAAFIKVTGARPGETLRVNGQELTIYEFGAFAENLVIGANTVEYNGRRYSLEIEDFEDTLPTIDIRREDFR